MNYEKLYKDARQRAKHALDCDRNNLASTDVLLIYSMFPELKGGEDERIREQLCDFLRDNMLRQDAQYFISWLEGQGQVKESHISQHESKTREENNEFLTNEDERIKETLKGVVKSYSAFINGQWRLGDFTVNRLIDWLEKQGEKTNPYSGMSFEYNGHIWGMCARDNGVDILLDKLLFKHLDTQGETKPKTWRAEDEQNLNVVLSFIDDEYLRRWLKDKLCYDLADILPWEVSKQVYQISWDCGKTFEQAFALLAATQKAYQRGKEDAKKELKKIEQNPAESTKDYNDIDPHFGIPVEDLTSTDKTEPKFKPGDWIIFNGLILHIDEIVNGYYRTTSIGDGIHNSYDWDIDNAARLWTIQDAKDGDVLVCTINKAEIGGDVEKLPNMTPTIFIYQNVVKDSDYIHSYCSLYNRSSLRLQNAMYYNIFVCYIHPATKEEHDLLFQKMKEAGCEWDSVYKKLVMR